jgi:hypothetical protein
MLSYDYKCRHNIKGHKTLIGFLMWVIGAVIILAASRKGLLSLITDNKKICMIIRVTGYIFGLTAMILSWTVDDIIE